MGRREKDLDPSAGPVAEFAAGLRDLRQRAGLTYRQLAARAHYSPSALSQAASGARLPNPSVVLAYVRACGGDEEEWRRRWARVAGQPDPATVPAEPPGPVTGLAAADHHRGPVNPFGPARTVWFHDGDSRVAGNLLGQSPDAVPPVEREPEGDPGSDPGDAPVLTGRPSRRRGAVVRSRYPLIRAVRDGRPGHAVDPLDAENLTDLGRMLDQVRRRCERSLRDLEYRSVKHSGGYDGPPMSRSVLNEIFTGGRPAAREEVRQILALCEVRTSSRHRWEAAWVLLADDTALGPALPPPIRVDPEPPPGLAGALWRALDARPRQVLVGLLVLGALITVLNLAVALLRH